MAGWEVFRSEGSASGFHGRAMAEVPTRRADVLSVDAPALVLGSTQPEADADHHALAAAGIELVRRRSGGGAVLLRAEEVLWVDLDVPRDDELWHDDVGRAFLWLGRAWVSALADLGVAADVHEGPLRSTRWSRQVCFAGLGPGEVTVDGAKVVGIAQRRTRAGARFQCAALDRWEPSATTSLLHLGPAERALADEELAGAAAGLGVGSAALFDALLARLPV